MDDLAALWHDSKRAAFSYVEVQQQYTLADDRRQFEEVVVRTNGLERTPVAHLRKSEIPAMLMEIEATDRNILIPLFENCQYDRVLIDSVLEGSFGSAYADSVSQPVVARLDLGAFTMLGGNPLAAGIKDLPHRAPIYYVTPQSNEWRGLLQAEKVVRQ